MKNPIQIWIGRKCFRKYIIEYECFVEEPEGITFRLLDFLSKIKPIRKKNTATDLSPSKI